MNPAITLEHIHSLFGGTIDSKYDRVLTSIAFPGGNVIASQIIRDPAAPDGIRVNCGPKNLDAVTDYVRQELGLPPLPRPANDNAAPSKKEPLGIKATPFAWCDPKKIPPRNCLY